MGFAVNGWTAGPVPVDIELWDGTTGHPRDDYKIVYVYTP
jgi:hypothetical protein